MGKGIIALVCIIAIMLPAASSAEPGVKHSLCGGSGMCISHSAGANLTSLLGRCAGTHSIVPFENPGKPAGPEVLAQASVVSDVGARVGLEQSFPNPFNPATSIRYSVKTASRVTLRVYDVNGGLVRTLVDGDVSAGEHTVPWDGMNARGVQASSGIYFVRLETEWGVFSRKMILAK